MPVNKLVENDQVVSDLRGAMRDGQSGLKYVPQLLHLVLEGRAWHSRIDSATRTEVGFDTFAEFVSTPPTEGLGADMELVRRIVRGTPVEDELDQQLKDDAQQGHRTDLVDNVNEVRPQGNSRSQALRRLRKDRPDLHKRVLSGEVSANWAMVEANFRPRTITVTPTRPESVAKALRKYMSDDDIAKLISILMRAG